MRSRYRNGGGHPATYDQLLRAIGAEVGSRCWQELAFVHRCTAMRLYCGKKTYGFMDVSSRLELQHTNYLCHVKLSLKNAPRRDIDALRGMRSVRDSASPSSRIARFLLGPRRLSWYEDGSESPLGSKSREVSGGLRRPFIIQLINHTI